MGGVNTNDQLMSCQKFPGNLIDGGCFLFWFVEGSHCEYLDIAAVPTKYKEQQPKGVPHWPIKNLNGTFSARERPVGQKPNATKIFDRVQHLVVKSETRGYCKNECGGKVKYKCFKCDIFHCIDCFLNYHTLKSTWNNSL